MSVSQFPNVTDLKATEIVDLVQDLMGPAMADPLVEDEITIIYGAHMCGAAETVLTSQKLQQYRSYDPAIVKKIKDLLDSCR